MKYNVNNTCQGYIIKTSSINHCVIVYQRSVGNPYRNQNAKSGTVGEIQPSVARRSFKGYKFPISLMVNKGSKPKKDTSNIAFGISNLIIDNKIMSKLLPVTNLDVIVTSQNSNVNA